jgi:predicted amino acid-binding ACT domain protein
MAVALVSILAQDRVGLVSELADHLFDAGLNLGDTTFAVLGTGAELTAACELPNGLELETLEQGLVQLPTLGAAQVRVVPNMFDPRPDETGQGTVGQNRSHTAFAGAPVRSGLHPDSPDESTRILPGTPDLVAVSATYANR